MSKLILAVVLFIGLGGTGANAQVQYMYNYSQVPIAPIAPIVQPYSGGYNPPVYMNQHSPTYGQQNTTVINSQGRIAICNTINNVTTCF